MITAGAIFFLAIAVGMSVLGMAIFFLSRRRK